MFSSSFIIYNSILLVFRPNIPNLFIHILFPSQFLPCLSHRRSRTEPAAPHEGVPAMSAVGRMLSLYCLRIPGAQLIPHCEQRPSNSIYKQILPIAATGPCNLHENHTTFCLSQQLLVIHLTSQNRYSSSRNGPAELNLVDFFKCAASYTMIL